MAQISQYLTGIPTIKEVIWRERFENEKMMQESWEIPEDLINAITEARLACEAKVDQDLTNPKFVMDCIDCEEFYYTEICTASDEVTEAVKDSFLKRIKLLLEYGIEVSCAHRDFLIKFSRFHGLTYYYLKNIFNYLLEKYSHKPEVWINIGRFYSYDMNYSRDAYYTEALTTFITGLKKHPGSKELHKELMNCHRECYAKFNKSNIDFDEFVSIHGEEKFKTMWTFQIGAEEGANIPVSSSNIRQPLLTPTFL